jgi:hypothetical protein
MTRLRWLLPVVAGLTLAACEGPPRVHVVEPASGRPSSHGPSTADSPARPPATGPLPSGSVSRADGPCPLVGLDDVAGDSGMRLKRMVVLSAAGRTVGCDFYSDPAWAASEHLPGPDQPAVSIRITRYAATTPAYNAMMRMAERSGSSAHSQNLGAASKGVVYRTTFDPADGNQDWAYAFVAGADVVIILTAQTDSELTATEIGQTVAPRL